MTHYTPENMYHWEEIAQFERINNVERIGNLAQQTHTILVANCRSMGFPSEKAFAQYYNNISNGLITNRRYNQFLYHSKLEPFAHLIKWVLKDSVSRQGNKIIRSDFGILKTQYEYYRKHGNPPDVFNRGGTKKNFTPAGENARTKVDLPKTQAYQQFVTAIKAANKGSRDKVTIPQMILLAIEEYMSNRPELFGNPEMSVARDSEIRIKDNEFIRAQISPETMKKLSALLARYNSANTVKMTQSQLVELAIVQMFERAPLMLSDPQLAEELREIEKCENQ